MRLLVLADEYTREALAIRGGRGLNSVNVIEAMADVMLVKDVPAHIRSENSLEMTAKIVRDRAPKVGASMLYIEPASRWENSYCESFNWKPRHEFLNGEIFYSLKEARTLIGQSRQPYKVRYRCDEAQRLATAVRRRTAY